MAHATHRGGTAAEARVLRRPPRPVRAVDLNGIRPHDRPVAPPSHAAGRHPNLGLRYLYDFMVWWLVAKRGASAIKPHRNVAEFLGAIAVILGFAWGSSNGLWKTAYLLGDYKFNAGVN